MDCTLQLQCAKLGFFFELSKKKVGKSSKNVDFPKKRLKYLCNSKNSCTFAADLKKSPAKSGKINIAEWAKSGKINIAEWSSW